MPSPFGEQVVAGNLIACVNVRLGKGTADCASVHTYFSDVSAPTQV